MSPPSDTPVLELTFCDVGGSPWEGRATVRFQGEPGDPFPVREGLTTRQRDDVRWYVERFMDFPEGGNETRAQQIEDLLAQHGRALWDGLKGPALQQWLGAVQALGRGRLELRAADPRDEIAFRTPWELMRVGLLAAGPGTLLHQLNVDVVRRVNAPVPLLAPLDTSHGLRVITIVCRPDDAGFLDPRYTPEAILEALAERPEVEVDFCRPGTLAALVDALQAAFETGRPYHVVHFDGHGDYLAEEGGVGILCFEKPDGTADPVRAQRFGDLMARFRVPLVVLEACRTAAKFFAQETVAGALLRQGVGTVVAMGHAVHVDMTRTLMEGFYGAIARGQSLGQSLQAGRNRLLAQPYRRVGRKAEAEGPDPPQVELQDWFVPQLYQGGKDPILLAEKGTGTDREKGTGSDRHDRCLSPFPRRPQPMFEGFGLPPRAGFQGRGYGLHRLERAVLRHKAVVIHAPGGMGKTALAREAARWWTRTGMFPDGAVFVSFERTQSPEGLLVELGQALEGIEFLQREDKEAWLTEQFRSRRMLLVWDNYESVLPSFRKGEPTPAEFARWAGQWTERGTRILLTCRDPSTGLDAWPFPLDELSEPEGLLLVVRFLERLGIDRPARVKRGLTVDRLRPIVLQTGGHPLALELLAPFVAKLGPEQVVAELGPLLAKAEQEHPEGRNRSMWASLDFSIRHLTVAARAALPAVALLSGGCLEEMAPLVAGLDQQAWAAVREELEHLGLVRVRQNALLPHPILGDLSLPLAAGEGRGEGVSPPLPLGEGRGEGGLAPSADLLDRFLGVVRALCAEFHKVVRSEHAKGAMVVMGICETVVRRAIDRAAQAGDLPRAWAMADSLNRFLQQSGRGGEGARLITDLDRRAGAGQTGDLTETAAALARQSAWARAASDPEGAAQALQHLLGRLEGIRAWDTRHQRARSLMALGRVHYGFRRRPAEALAPLQEAEGVLQALEHEGRIDSTNRAAVLGSRANALTALGRWQEALAAAEQGLALHRQRGDLPAAARGLGRIAQILAGQGRLQEAEARYGEALEAAQQAGDDEAVGTTYQHLGNLALHRGRPEEAAGHLRAAVAAFQQAGNEQGQMQVLNSLGNVERQRGNAQAALAWVERSLDLALKVEDLEGEAMARGNRAALWSEQAQEAADPDLARRLLAQAIGEEREVLALMEQLGQPGSIAISHSNLANRLRQAGQLEEAQGHAEKALAIREQIGHPETWRTLRILEQIAEARGDAGGAAEYRRRKEAAQQEAEERAGTPSLPVEGVFQLLQLAVMARAQGVALQQALDAIGAGEGYMAKMDQRDPWLAAHLRALAGGQPRPAVDVPGAFADLIDQAWAAAGAG